MRTRLVLPLAFAVSACTPTEPTRGLPVGDSTWSGTGVVSGITFLLDVTLTNQGGDMTGSVTVSDSPDAPVGLGTGTYTVTGIHEPRSGVIALAPNDWTVRPDVDIELVGFIGEYDPETGALTGTLADFASKDDNSLNGEAADLVLETADGEPLELGDDGLALPTGEVLSFAGTSTCTSAEREVLAALTFDGLGSVTGTVTYGDVAIEDDPHTFEVTGVHNATTGGITLVPGLYTVPGEASFLTFFLDGDIDPATGSFTADGRTNVGPCPTSNGWAAQL